MLTAVEIFHFDTSPLSRLKRPSTWIIVSESGSTSILWTSIDQQYWTSDHVEEVVI